MLTELCARLAKLPALDALAGAISARPANQQATLYRLSPLIGAARPPIVAALASRLSTPLLYIVSSTAAALRTVDDLQMWLPQRCVLHFAISDTLPYEQMAPSPEILRQRLQVLHALAGTTWLDAPPIVVVAMRALQQPTLKPEELATATTRLRLHSNTPQNNLVRTWLAQGYQPVAIVQQPADLARRGGIVDIWPPADEQPLRIEWFGDEIDSLRRFEPGTQRSEQRIETALIGPVYEFPYWQHDKALERITALDVRTLRPEAQASWRAALERMAAGEHTDSWSFFAPFYRTEDGLPSLLQHLPAGSVVAFDEALLLSQVAHEWQDRSEDQYNQLIDGSELPRGFPRPYLRWEELIGSSSTPAAGLALLDLSNNAELDVARWITGGAPLDVRAYATPGFQPEELFGGQLKRLVQAVVERLRGGEEVVMVTPQAARLQELVSETYHASNGKGNTLPAGFTVVHGALSEGWHLPDQRLILYTDSEIFGWQQHRSQVSRRARKQRTENERAAFLRGLKPGDYVVHIEHGIAVYEGLLRRTVADIEREYLSLRYAAGDRLYVPVDQVDRVARYIGAGDAAPQLTRLGTQEWERAKRKARAAVRDLADDLLEIYARRQTQTGHAFEPDNEWQRELENAFPYVETADQLQALGEIKHDMESPHPMDRLICGDVGFGKTEVALRAAFKAVQSGRQVAVLVPTTVLAQQHYNTFRQRMAAFPLNIEMLSRFRTPKEQDAIVERTTRGEIDILIGTHRLLSKDVRFKDLGLLIVDEEQRFGVRHKEQLKQMRAAVDVLTLTATPIPRTLHMTLAGIRDMSLINTPPEDRIPIKTYVVPYDDTLVRESIERELGRGGQVYFVHNRVQSIYHIANKLQKLVPDAEIGVAHGQMDERELEQMMMSFFKGEYDVLVCTTIIENGLDVPNANTLIIDEAPNYGLAQLYQLRGRVGRATNRAYAYLLYRQDKPMTEEAQQRLQVIQEATELGAGFRIAMRDLEIRGAGNLLGAEQSGHIAAVGFDLYSRLLEQAVHQLKAGKSFDDEDADTPPPADPATDANGEPPPRATRPKRGKTAADIVVNEKILVSPLVTLDLPLTAYLPEDYIDDDTVRLGVYQRMAEANTPPEVQALRQELRDRFGELPEPAANLLTWLLIKALALHAGINSVITTDEEFIVRLPTMDTQGRERIKRRFGRDKALRVGPQFLRLDRRELNGNWADKLIGVLDVLGR
ncbi:MAG: transcription-repair coupling factor [Chloroflexaceae bacterium]|nr:transcription-repair coupling factor [Chloroflexaceae bacterium]